MDDIRPPRGNYGSSTPNGYGRPTTSAPQSNQNVGQPTPVTTQQPSQDGNGSNYNLRVAKKSGKKSKIIIILLIILTLAASAFAAWEYMELKDLQSEVDELQVENKRLNERVYSLNYDNRDLNQKIELLTSENESLKELNQSLIDACGNACTTVIP